LIDTAKLFGLLLLFGGASFHFLLWSAGEDRSCDALKQAILNRTVTVMAAGLFLALLAGVASLEDPLFGAEQLLLALLFFVGHYLGARTNNNALHALAVLAGLGLIGMQALTSHAAAESGFLPILSSSLHWAVAISWGGGALHLAWQPWPALVEADARHHARITSITHRYAVMSLATLVVLALTGGLLGFIHVHNADALNTTAYGTAYKAKVLLALALFITVSIHYLRIVPACRAAVTAEALHRALQRFRRLVGAEAILFVGLVVATSSLSTRAPSGVAPFLNPQSWSLTAGGVPLHVALQPVAGRVSRARLEISAASEDFRFPEGTVAVFSLVTASGDAGLYDVEALPIGPAAFLGETVLAVPGDWRFDLMLDYTDREPAQATYLLTLPGPPLEDDMRAYLKVSTIAYSRASLITFSVGVFLILVAAWSIRLSGQNRAPVWLMPVSLINVALGGFLILSLMFVKTYPSSFWPNPQPFTFDVVREGDALYREHCAECHGITGAGDGPWAVQERGSIPDLTLPHMDTHTDGEIFWWNKYGIPSLDMPALGDELTDADNWKVIIFVRSLRHGIPAQ